MLRAGIFIGVDRTGDLPRLHAAARSAAAMHRWAEAQPDPHKVRATLITDEHGQPVTSDRIQKAVFDLLDGAGVDQLVVYFSGHGVNIGGNEYWLLSDAPRNTSAAVNVSGSATLARYCGVGYVAVISDACRVAAEGIRAQSVRGVEIFPNEPRGQKGMPVDQFFACSLGLPAFEVRDPEVAAKHYTAIYTESVLRAFEGKVPDVLGQLPAGGRDGVLFVWPAKLRDFLEAEVPRRLRELNMHLKIHQTPDAVVLAHPHWLACVGPTAEAAGAAEDAEGAEAGSGTVEGDQELRAGEAPRTIRVLAKDLVREAAEGRHDNADSNFQHAAHRKVAGARRLAETVHLLSAPFGPDHFESECGIKVRGARITEFFTSRATVSPVGRDDDQLRVQPGGYGSANVLIELSIGFGTVVPVIPGFIAGLTIDESGLVDVAYEPASNNWRWGEYSARASQIRALRAVAAASWKYGRFRLEGPDAGKVASQMQLAKGVDPTLSVYAAYAYHDSQELDRIRTMASYQEGDIGATFFDVALVGRMLLNRTVAPVEPNPPTIVPFIPMLTRGWALLGAHGVRLAPSIAGMERGLRPTSLWSLFDAAAMDQLKVAMRG